MPTSQAKLSKQARKSGVSGVTHVAIIGAGRGGTALMEIFANDPLVDIVAVAEIDESAPGLALANCPPGVRSRESKGFRTSLSRL